MAKNDYKTKLVDYFKKNLSKGYTPESLKIALIRQGYMKHVLEEALDKANKELAEKAPLLKTKPIIKHEIIDKNDKLIPVKKPFWKRFF
ncbi:MAG: hypothetical protein KKF68_03870 [Nanoarchaeota archaeon]|nr:hypothetical protein [Nanoarchaeota archaeon]